ncbi:hypothetical protein LINGRAHAP2_LOCUS29121 [Linum grandiflorum]
MVLIPIPVRSRSANSFLVLWIALGVSAFCSRHALNRPFRPANLRPNCVSVFNTFGGSVIRRTRKIFFSWDSLDGCKGIVSRFNPPRMPSNSFPFPILTRPLFAGHPNIG